MSKAILLAGATLLGVPVSLVQAAVFVPTSGSASWNSGGNWDTASVPNAAAAVATFNGPTAARTVTLDAPQTVGTLNLNTDVTGSFSNSITGSTVNTLTIDAGAAGVGGGPADINVTGVAGATGNTNITAPLVLTDSVTITVDNTFATSAAGALTLTGSITGGGGITKNGAGLLTVASGGTGGGTKTFTGPVVINGGRFRTSAAAYPTATSALSVNAGGQLTPATAGTYTFGSSAVSLAGNGTALFAGAIRPDSAALTGTGGAVIANAINLTANASVVASAALGAGSMTLSGPIGGGFQFTVGSGGAGNTATVILQGANTYSGGTSIEGGRALLNTPAATLGTGDVSVLNVNGPTSLEIAAGVLNAIADTATLSLAGGGTTGFAVLGTGVSETVGGLLLAGAPQAPGIYGSSAAAALNPLVIQNDNFFSAAGTGVVVVVPEPATASLLGLATLGILARRRRA